MGNVYASVGMSLSFESGCPILANNGSQLLVAWIKLAWSMQISFTGDPDKIQFQKLHHRLTINIPL